MLRRLITMMLCICLVCNSTAFAVLAETVSEPEVVQQQESQPAEISVQEENVPAPAAEVVETPAPAAVETPAPAVETPAPAVETPAPTATEAPAATETPAEESTPAVTEAPEETPEAEVTPTEVPENSTESAGENVEKTEDETVETAPTEAPEATPVPTEVPEAEVTPAETPEATPVPTEVPEAEVTPTEVPEENVIPETELTVQTSTEYKYAFANEDTVSVDVQVKGGIAPYTLTLSVENEGNPVKEIASEAAAEGKSTLSYQPTAYGVHTFKVSVEDSTGKQVSSSVKVPVAVREEENGTTWADSVAGVTLTGDWRDDLTAIAKTQIGYKENKRNFIIENDKVYSYTRYGDWYNKPYEKEWDTLFAAFCLEYAHIPASKFPREADAEKWVRQIVNCGAYETDKASYEPEKGDLVYLAVKGSGAVNHVAIVEKVSETRIYTIEADLEAGKIVREDYALTDGKIKGYASMKAMMLRAGIEVEEDEETEEVTDENEITEDAATEEIPEENTAAGENAEDSVRNGYTTAERVNMRAAATVESDVLVRIDPINTPLTVLGEEETNGELWYYVQFEAFTGYIRSDLMFAEEVKEQEVSVEAVETEDETDAEAGEIVEEELDSAESEADAADLITEEPEDYNGAIGEIAVFTIAAEENVTYQWQRAPIDTEEWQDITDDAIAVGWNTSELQVVITEESASYLYRCGVNKVEEEKEANLVASLLDVLSVEVHAAENNGYDYVSQPVGINIESRDIVQSIDLSDYTRDFLIYNYLKCIAASSTELLQGSGTFTLTGKLDDAYGIRIGDQPNDNTETQPYTQDIKVVLNQVTSSRLEVLCVNGGSNSLDISVNSGSEIGSIVINSAGVLNLNIPSGVTFTVNTISGAGKLNISGSGTLVVKESIALTGDLNINGSTIDGSTSGSITAGNITLESGTIRNCELFGYGSDASGDKILSLGTNVHFDNVKYVGASLDTNALVRVEGNITSTQASYYIRDYKITYYNDEESIDAQMTWPSSYRVSTSNLNAENPKLVGYHMGSFYIQLEDEKNSITLPNDYKEDGYVHEGWYLGSDSENIVNSIDPQIGELSLTLALKPWDVLVTYDLDYEPSKYTNDAYENMSQITQVDSFVDATLSDQSPIQFGYLFEGWVINDSEKIIKPGGIYKIQVSDLLREKTDNDNSQNEDDAELENSESIYEKNEAGQYLLNLTAVWKPRTYKMSFTVPSNVNVQNIRVYAGENQPEEGEAEEDWLTIEKFVEKYASTEDGSETKFSWDAGTNAFTFTDIAYGTSLKKYFGDIGIKFLTLKDDSNEWVFEEWITSNQLTVNEDMNFAYAETQGILDNIGATELLTEYESRLAVESFKLGSLWVEPKYKLIVDQTDGWVFYVDGKPVTFDENSETIVTAGAEVSMRTTDINKTISGWKPGYIQNDNGTKSLEWIVPDAEKINKEYAYTFKMPTADVVVANLEKTGPSNAKTFLTQIAQEMNVELGYNPEAFKLTDVWLNLAESPVEFDEKIVAGDTRSFAGFWYEKILTSRTPVHKKDNKYYYEWKSTDIQITSKNEPTQNQLRLINTINVYLKECNLAARWEYLAAAQGLCLNGVEMVTKWHQAKRGFTDTGNDAWAAYGNIVLDNTRYANYTTNLYIMGNNTVTSIFHNQYKGSNSYLSTLNIKNGTNGVLNLGSIWGNFNVNFSGITINEVAEENSEYLVWTSVNQSTTGNVQFTSCNVNVPKKTIYSGFGSIYYSGTTAIVNNTHHAYYSYVQSGSKVHIKGEAFSYYWGFDLSGNSTCVIEGSFRTNGYEYNGVTINNSNFIVKGNICDTGTLKMNGNSLLIANALVVSRSLAISGGTVIANQIMNMPCGRPVFGANGKYTSFGNITGAIESASSNGDNVPFLTYSNNSNTADSYVFSGGNIYLLGYYGNSSGVYDMSLKATTAGNPMAGVVNALGTGTAINSGAAISQASVLAKNSSHNECIIIGNSNYIAGQAKARAVTLSGANIYASGNLTFFNDTTISNGNIECTGTLSSKRELNITGGSISASEVGNAYNLTTNNSRNGLERYHAVKISGGTVKTEIIGALTKSINNTTARSNVSITGGTILNLSGSNSTATRIVTDVLVQYVYSDTMFENQDENPVSLRFSGTYNHEAGYKDADMSLMDDSDQPIESISFGMPITLPKTEPLSEGIWKLDNLQGPNVNTVKKDTHIYNIIESELTGESLVEEKIYQRENLPLYAAKSQYNLIVKANEEASLLSIKWNNTSEEAPKVNNSYQVNSGGKVVLQLQNQDMMNRTVVWYYDGSQVLHNALVDAERNYEALTITFEMPFADTEIWVTKDLPLDLYLYDIKFTDEGFDVELEANRRNDSAFLYYGNIIVQQSNLISTSNRISHGSTPGSGILAKDSSGRTDIAIVGTDKRIIFAAGSGNLNGKINRKITITKVQQNCFSEYYGISITDGEQVELTIDGAVELCPVLAPGNTTLHLSGDNKQSDVLYIKEQIEKNYMLIGNLKGAAGTVAFRNLWLQHYRTEWVYSKTKTSNPVTYDNCLIDTNVYNVIGYATNTGDVIIRDCDIEAYNGSDLADSLFSGVNKVTFINSRLNFKSGGKRGYQSLFNGMETFTMEDSNIILTYRNTDSSVTNYEDLYKGGNLVMNGNSTLTADHRLKLNSLKINEGSTLNVRSKNNENQETYLMCPDITVNGGNITADYILVSGYYDGTASTSKEAVLIELKNNTSIKDGEVSPGLVLHSGSVNANKFVGGDVNGNITINGGTLTAPKIGTYGAVFGYSSYIPFVGEEYVYQYAKAPVKATVTVNNGTVIIPEDGILGGQNCIVNICGGTVKAEDGTNGAIAVSGTGNVNISGEATKVYVHSMKADGGTITISETKGSYDNAWGNNGRPVGVHVEDTLNAENIIINNGAVVYAGLVYVTADKGTGVLNVETDKMTRGYLYTRRYELGEELDSSKSEYFESDKGTDQNLFGLMRVPILYVLNGDVDDPATNHEGNPKDFDFNSNSENNYQLDLQDPTRPHYDFTGWYTTEDLSGEPISYISTNVLQNSITLYAGWKPQTVTFSVVIYKKDFTSLTDFVYQDEIKKANGEEIETGKFKFTKTVEIPYKSSIYGNNAIYDQDFKLLTYVFKELSVDDDRYELANKVLSLNEVVTDKILDAFNKNRTEPLQLKISLLDPNAKKLTLDLNLNDKQKARDDVKFLSNNNLEMISAEQATFVAENNKFLNAGKAPGFVVKDTEGNFKLIEPTAPGYVFEGWYSDESCTEGNKITLEHRITESDSVFYAKWTPITYELHFKANVGTDTDNLITMGTLPTNGDEAATFVGELEFDKQFSDINFTKVLNSNGNEITTEEITNSEKLPKAWKNGYVHQMMEIDENEFLTWLYKDTVSSKETSITQNTWLDYKEITGLPVENVTDKPVVDLIPDYKPVEVIYHLAEGTWVNNTEPTNTPEYGTALAGYTMNPGNSGTSFELYGTMTGSDNTSYSVVSSTAEYFSTNKAYVENDYRNTLIRKGYTFNGWREANVDSEGNVTFDQSSKYVGTVPQYEDIEVVAEWTPNTYTVNLYNGKDSKYVKYGTKESNKVSPVKVSNITVGQEIDSVAWVGRTEWYAYSGETGNPDAELCRYLLGFTFDFLDPGNADSNNKDGYEVYKKYAAAVNNLIGLNAIFTKREDNTSGTIFYLPEDRDYSADHIAGTNKVADYPNGSSIAMYAIYRERSLVFVHYFRESDGSITQKVMSSGPWNEYSTYPDTTYKTTDEYTDMAKNGYQLIGWYVNGVDKISSPYPETEEDYKSKMEEYKFDAATMGTYDIMVYSRYAAQVKAPFNMTAVSDPMTNAQPYEYTIPGSMAEGKVSYTLSNNDSGLKFVSEEDMLAHQYDTSWTSADGNTTYTANDTVALKVELIDPENTSDTQAKYILGTSGVISDTAAGAKWIIRFTLIHSKVMSNTITYDFDLKITIGESGASTTAEQYILFEDSKINIVPSVYEVTYQAEMPTVTDVIIESLNGYEGDASESLYKKTAKVAYGSAIDNVVPKLEGYKGSGSWLYHNPDNVSPDETITSEDLTLDVKVSAANNGKITLQTSYDLLKFLLSADENVQQRWNVKNGETDLDWSPEKEEIPYQSTVTVNQKENQEDDYVFVKYQESRTDSVSGNATTETVIKWLDVFAGDDLIFNMPAHDIELFYEDILTLYLEDGDIDITATHVKQTAADGSSWTHTWPGGYRILQNREKDATSPTQHTLSISGNMTDRMIELGELNINKVNSISITGENTVAELTVTGNITATNVAVSESSKLVLNADTDSEKEKLILSPKVNYAAIGGSLGGGSGDITLNNVDIAMSLPVGTSSGIGPASEDAVGESIYINNAEISVEQSTTYADSFKGVWIGGSKVTKVELEKVSISHGDTKQIIGPEIIHGNEVEISYSSIGTANSQLNNPIKANDSLSISNSTVYITLATGNLSAPIATAESGDIYVANGSTVIAGVTGTINEYYEGEMHITCDSVVDIQEIRLIDVKADNTEVRNLTVNSDGYNHGSVTHSGYTGDFMLLGSNEAADVTVNRNTKIYLDLGKHSTGVQSGNAVKVDEMKHSEDVNFELIGSGQTLDVTSITGEGNLILTGKGNGGLIIASTSSGIGTSNGFVGSTGGSVTFNGENTINAVKIGSLGDGTKAEFTAVTLSEDASLTYKGNLVRDWYCIEYDLLNGSFTKDSSGVYPEVFRTSEIADTPTKEEDNEGESTMTLSPALDSMGSTVGFDYWYVKDDGKKLENDNDKISTLTYSLKEYATSDTTVNKGILTLYLTIKPEYLNLTGSKTLTAAESTYKTNNNGTDTYVFDFNSTTANDNRALLKGKTLYVKSITVESVNNETPVIDTVSNMKALETTAGSDYANSTFAFTANWGTAESTEKDMYLDVSATKGTNLGEVNGQLTIRLHNANALTKSTTAGKVTMVLSTSEDINKDAGATDLITLTFTIDRVASQINVTVPLVLVVKTDIDGGSVDVDNSGYNIKNNSSMRVQLTGVTQTDAGEGVMDEATGLTGSDGALEATSRNTYFIKMKEWQNTNLYAKDSTAPASDSYNPIDKVFISPLSFVTEDDPTKGVHFATLTYTLQIPEENLQDDSNQSNN